MGFNSGFKGLISHPKEDRVVGLSLPKPAFLHSVTQNGACAELLQGNSRRIHGKFQIDKSKCKWRIWKRSITKHVEAVPCDIQEGSLIYKKGEKREKSIQVNTTCHTQTDRAISGTLRSDTEKYCYQGWPDRRCSQGWRKHKCLPRQR